MEDYAEAMIAVLDQLNISRCLVAGHSMGGYVALAMADLYPERISGLSLVHSSSYADDDERKVKRDQVLNFIAENGGTGIYTSICTRSVCTRLHQHARN